MPNGWRAVAEQLGKRLRTPIQPPGVSRRITYQKLLELQARKLRDVVLGRVDQYEPFRAR